MQQGSQEVTKYVLGDIRETVQPAPIMIRGVSIGLEKLRFHSEIFHGVFGIGVTPNQF